MCVYRHVNTYIHVYAYTHTWILCEDFGLTSFQSDFNDKTSITMNHSVKIDLYYLKCHKIKKIKFLSFCPYMK